MCAVFVRVERDGARAACCGRKGSVAQVKGALCEHVGCLYAQSGCGGDGGVGRDVEHDLCELMVEAEVHRAARDVLRIVGVEQVEGRRAGLVGDVDGHGRSAHGLIGVVGHEVLCCTAFGEGEGVVGRSGGQVALGVSDVLSVAGRG